MSFSNYYITFVEVILFVAIYTLTIAALVSVGILIRDLFIRVGVVEFDGGSSVWVGVYRA